MVRLPVLLHIVVSSVRAVATTRRERASTRHSRRLLQRKSAQKQTLTKPPDDGGGQHALLKISAPTTDHALQMRARWALCVGKTSYFRHRAEANVKLEATPKKKGRAFHRDVSRGFERNFFLVVCRLSALRVTKCSQLVDINRSTAAVSDQDRSMRMLFQLTNLIHGLRRR